MLFSLEYHSFRIVANRISYCIYELLKAKPPVVFFFSLVVLSPLIVEHYYTTNIQKNQLVQNDIRVAKRLQDEEEERLAQQSTVLRQTSRQL